MSRSALKRHDSHIIIVGCGRLGSGLAGSLSEGGESVVMIDMNKEASRKLPPSFSGITVVGDATHTEVLSEARIEKARALIAVTNSDNVNVMVAQLARVRFEVETVVARIHDPVLNCVLDGLDIQIICPASLSFREVNRIIGDV